MPEHARDEGRRGSVPLVDLEEVIGAESFARLQELDIGSVEELVARLSDPDDAAMLARFTGMGVTTQLRTRLQSKLPLSGSARKYQVSTGAKRRTDALPRIALGGATSSKLMQFVAHVLSFWNRPAAHPPAGSVPHVFPTRHVTTDLPSQVELLPQRQGFLVPRQQGDRNTCVAFSSCAAAEFMLPRGSYLSPQHMYWACKEADGYSGQGTYLDSRGTAPSRERRR